MLISVIISTYNKPQFLNKVIEGLQFQSDSNFEIVVADDGSGSSTRELIKKWQEQSVVPITHAWQDDLGFRVSESRNNAVRHSKGDYFIFIDGDCIPRYHFVAHHRQLSEKNYVVAGNRCLLSDRLTRDIVDRNLPVNFSRFDLIRLRLSGDLNRLDALLSVSPTAKFRYSPPKKWQRLRGCNIGIWKDDFVKVNGFDSSFIGWGFEDSDLAARLINAGVKIKSGTFSTALLHLYHKESDEKREGHNWERFQYVLKSGDIYPIQGLFPLETMSKCNL